MAVSGLMALDGLAVLVFGLGFLMAFRPNQLRGLLARLAGRAGGPGEAVSEDVASALRIGGVMMMAFSVTICVFANLIAHLSASAAVAGG